MSSYNNKLKSLVDALIAKTAANDLDWEASAADGAVQTNLPHGLVVISPDRDESNQEAVRVSIFEDGQLKISFDDTEIHDWAMNGERVYYFTRMQTLLDDALRSARGESKILDGVLSDLGVPDDEVPF